MIVYLHRNLAPLSRLVPRSEHARYGATTHIHVIAGPTGLYRVEVTDGHRLVIVQGPSDASAEPYDWLPPDWQQEDGDAFVPREVWENAFKIRDSFGNGRPIGLATTDSGVLALGCEGNKIAHQAEPAGRWPEVDRVFPNRPAVIRFRFDPLLMLDILKLAAALHDGSPWIELIYYGKDVPFGLMTANYTGQTLDALIVPLTAPEPKPGPNGEGQ